MVRINDIIVSVRMPASLSSELKRLVKEDHFTDLSEEIRSIVRKEWLQSTKPELYELKKLRDDIGKEIKKKAGVRVQEEINKELERIKKQLQKGGLL